MSIRGRENFFLNTSFDVLGGGKTSNLVEYTLDRILAVQIVLSNFL